MASPVAKWGIALLDLLQSLVADGVVRVVGIRPSLAVLFVRWQIIGIKQAAGIRQIQRPFADCTGKPLVVAHHWHERRRLLEAVHLEGVVVASVVGLANQTGHVQSAPGADDGAPAAQLAAVEGPIDHFFHVVIGAEFGVHLGCRQRPVRQLQLIGWIGSPFIQKFDGPFRRLEVARGCPFFSRHCTAPKRRFRQLPAPERWSCWVRPF